MGFFAALSVRCAEADHGAAGDQRRPIVVARALDRRSDGFGIVPVDAAGRPARGLEPRQLVIRTAQRGRSVDRNLVVVEQHDQPLEPEVPGERNRLVAEAFHQAAVARDHIGIVIDEIVAEAGVHQPLGERHADRGRDALPERAGGGLDPRRMAIFGMARRLRPPLPESPELVQRHAFVAGQMQQRIEQHRAVTGGQHETVAIRPGRIGRIELRKRENSTVATSAMPIGMPG